MFSMMFQSASSTTEQPQPTEDSPDVGRVKGRRYRGVQKDEEVVRAVLDSVRTGAEPTPVMVAEARSALPRWMVYRGIEVAALRVAGVPDAMLGRLGLIADENAAIEPSAEDAIKLEGQNGQQHGDVSDAREFPVDGDSDVTAGVAGYVPRQRGPASSIKENVLTALGTYPGGRLADPSGLTNGLLRERMGYQGSPMNVSRILAVLEHEGLITRVIFGKRCPVIELTERGAEVVQEIKRRRGAQVITTSTDERGAHVSSTAPRPSVPSQRQAPSVVGERAYIPPLSERWAARTTQREFPVAGAGNDTDTQGGLSDEDVLWELDGQSAAAPSEDLSLRRRIRELSAELEREQALSAELRGRLMVTIEDRTDLRLRVKSLEDDLAMYVARSAQLEKNLDAVMRGPDRTVERQLEQRRMSNMISSRPG